MCGTEIPWNYNGTIESLGFPNEYYGDQYCWYYFSFPNTFSTWRISFTYFNLPNTSCDSDFIEVYSYSPTQRFCQNSTPPDLRDVYRILFNSSLNASAGFGFQANVSMVLECGNADIRLHKNISYSLRFRQNYPMQGRCEWALTADQGLTIMMIGYFYGSESRNQQIRMYRGPTKDENSLITVKSRYNMITLDEASNNILVEYIASYTSYFDLSVMFLATENSTCGSVTNASAGDIDLSTYSSDYINGYHRNGICVWSIEVEEDEIIQLLITELHIETETRCNEYARTYLAIYDGSQTDGSLLVRLCSADVLPSYNPVTSTTRRLVVVLTLDEDFGFTRAAFAARYKSFNESAILRDCGGDISGEEGVVSSPNYPANYDNLRVCEWRITVEEFFNIRVDIHDLDIESLFNESFCDGDSLLITGAYPSGQVYRLCGRHVNKYGLVIYSASNNLTMRFVSDWENNGRGFNASWRKACEWPLKTSSGWIQSLRFPATYLDNLSCSYFIGERTYQPGISYIFTFETFDLQEPDSNGSCIYDYLEILQVPSYNPGYFVPPEAKKVCGKAPMQSLTTYFPTTLHFVTDGNITKGGFNISFVSTMAGCGESLLVGEEGFITSPNHPGVFPLFLRCNTTIRVQPGHKILLTFTSFFLSENLQPDNGQECRWWSEASLDIYDRLSTGSAWIGT
ncbi:cubilin-like [Pomacea canaliculata]|uniref:cubilin-like n=1 Tax=Pomacea canaliculata TaxID=400727 RepID=UPI000D73FFBB|nr:cubilin-like [Pomacea canaliculata]